MAEILLGNIKGENGATYTPALDSDGNLSWSNDKGLPNPPTVNIKGPQGPAGSGGGGGSGDGIPRTGNRGVLGGFNDCNATLVVSDTTITIDENSPDDMTLLVTGGATLTLEFASNSTSAYVKNIFMMVDGASVVTNFGQSAFADTFFQSYVNDLGLSMANQIVVTSYFSEETGNWVIVSNKVLM